MKMQETLSTFQREDSISSDSNKEFHPDRLSEEEEDEALVIPQPNLGNRTRSQPNLRRVAPILSTSSLSSSGGDSPCLLRNVERVLPNGDLYIGTFLGNAPHGTGKYLWADGCMYEGEWRKGKASGKGRFSWPSGATYEGEFRSGRMDGYGIFTGTDGDTYRGFWVADRKQGHGEKLYANGDVYDGNWKDNAQGGEGKYVWKNGNVYNGEWHNGVISGKGVLIWANGNKYEGHWETGNPKGAGVFTRSDGSTYAGNWGNEMENEQCGQLPTTNTKKVASVDGAGRHSVSERGVNFPRICIWEADEEAGDITCDILDKVEASKLYREARDSCNGLNRSPRQCHSRAQSPRPYWSGGGDDEIKKPGQTISVGHKNYDLMLNLQLGIRHSVGKHASKTRNLKQSDFEPREKYWTRFPTEGSKCTPPHQTVDFKWKDYCPLVFRHLRDLFGIDPADYMLAICGSDALREFSSPGKSGSCFYLTQDDRFMIKTVKKAEVKVLIKMLPNYYKHVYQYKNTLVTKFFGVHCVKPVGGQKTRFVVMANLFHSEYRIHKRFDLKGSSHGRSTDKPDGEIDETTTLKDLDLNFVFRLQKSWFEELIRQIDRDCEFLEAERIMDYSLLIGLHFRDDFDDMTKSPNGRADDWNSPRMDNLSKIDPRDTDWIMDGRRPFIRLGANMPARAERVMRIEFEQNASFGRSNGTCSRNGNGTPLNGTPNNGTPLGGTPRARGLAEVYEVVLYFGIIDILQDYDISKKLEHAYKSWQVDPTSISAVDPKLYSKRFRDFLNRIFVEDE